MYEKIVGFLFFFFFTFDACKPIIGDLQNKIGTFKIVMQFNV